MEIELHLSHRLKMMTAVYVVLSSGILTVAMTLPKYRRMLFQSWVAVTSGFQFFIIILLFLLISQMAQLIRIRNEYRKNRKKGKNI